MADKGNISNLAGSLAQEVAQDVVQVTHVDSGVLRQVMDLFLHWGLNLGWALVILIIGWIMSGWAERTVEAALSRIKVADQMLRGFFASMARWLVLSLTGVLLGEMTPRAYPHYRQWLALTLYACLENFGYRQLTTVLRLLGTWDYIFKLGSWGKMEHTGMAQKK